MVAKSLIEAAIEALKLKNEDKDYSNVFKPDKRLRWGEEEGELYKYIGLYSLQLADSPLGNIYIGSDYIGVLNDNGEILIGKHINLNRKGFNLYFENEENKKIKTKLPDPRFISRDLDTLLKIENDKFKFFNFGYHKKALKKEENDKKSYILQQSIKAYKFIKESKEDLYYKIVLDYDNLENIKRIIHSFDKMGEFTNKYYQMKSKLYNKVRKYFNG